MQIWIEKKFNDIMDDNRDETYWDKLVATEFPDAHQEQFNDPTSRTWKEVYLFLTSQREMTHPEFLMWLHAEDDTVPQILFEKLSFLHTKLGKWYTQEMYDYCRDSFFFWKTSLENFTKKDNQYKIYLDLLNSIQ